MLGILFLIIEIIIAGMLAVRLGREAHDKGFSNILFIFLAGALWFITRIVGSVIGFMIVRGTLGSMATGWIFAIGSYCLFYYLISRMKDKELFNEHEVDWKKKNAAASSETGKLEDK